jgi:hypothetical protein
MQCSRAVDQLTKKTIHPEIESDYERNIDENQSEQHPSKNSVIINLYCLLFYSFTIATTSTISSLKSVPFASKFLKAKGTFAFIFEYFIEQNSNMQPRTTSTITVSTERSGILDIFH